jgi:tetratricopeptide (TPR) repeat protein
MAMTTEQALPRKLVAILYADVEGYSRLTGADEVGTHRTLSAIRGAIEIDPQSLLYRVDLSIGLMVARRNDEAIAEAKGVLAREPTASQAWWVLGWAYLSKGAHDAAIHVFQKRAELTRIGGVALYVRLQQALNLVPNKV